jgi:hypothetical protein
MAAALAALALGCSGGGSGGGASEPGTGHAADDLDTDKDPIPVTNPCAGDPANPCAGDPTNPCASDPAVDPNAPLVTFQLHNSHDVPLEFSIEKGWSLIVSGYSGKPPKATPIILFPSYCTASCDADEQCPTCEKPEGVKEEKEAENRIAIEPGQTHELAWDGQVHAYEKVKRSCQCYRKQPVPPETYTLRACGLRVTKSAKKTSKFQCVTTEVQLPPEAPTTIKFDFGKPE